ncbi:putative O-methyltransferase YrrM [Flavobacterium endophyticum]|uniref:Putative O-methyltransferase YrrM n=1 Tax=Flavobacterium endophyticum TaxID=1540163 RepID=A0A495MKA0_9FLAO|nr:class I SAM-dependent methyltransferase [Flavobacterium endophyticum]RKS25462.1 putative O-methyltransferase YrrM [Flavobacterium endophyticum]
MHILTSYLKFLWNSSNAHGVHSPFVFDLVRKCFYDTKKYGEYKTLKKYRDSLLENKKTIEVTDFGSGSRVFKSNIRAINQIAKNAGVSSKNARLLFRIVRYFQPENVLEIGTSLGLATSALTLGNSKAKITTLEGCPHTAKVAQQQFQDFNFSVTSVVTKFEAYLESENIQSATYDLIYFDGNHSKEATLHYFEALLPTIANNTVWIFDDIHWSSGMQEAWETIKKHPKVTVTIDTFQWGLVFFRKEQEKEHFILRTSNYFVVNSILGIRKLWGLLP